MRNVKNVSLLILLAIPMLVKAEEISVSKSLSCQVVAGGLIEYKTFELVPNSSGEYDSAFTLSSSGLLKWDLSARYIKNDEYNRLDLNFVTGDGDSFATYNYGGPINAEVNVKGQLYQYYCGVN